MKASAFTWYGRWKNTRCRPAWSASTAAPAASRCWSRCEDADRIILIDAAADGNPIGTVTRTTPRFSRDYPPTLTAHDIGMKDLLDMFYIQGGEHDIVLYAITIDPRQPIRMSLSAEGEKSAAVAVKRILAELWAEFRRPGCLTGRL